VKAGLKQCGQSGTKFSESAGSTIVYDAVDTSIFSVLTAWCGQHRCKPLKQLVSADTILANPQTIHI
jgi:hypothetical protein